MNCHFFKQLAVVVSFLTAVSSFQLEAGNVTVEFTTNFDSNYLVYISPLGKGGLNFSQSENITLNDNGTARWSGNKEKGQWVQVTFMPAKRDRQIGASFPLYLSRESENISFTYSDTEYVTLQPCDISAENKVLIQYSTFINQMMFKRFKSIDKSSGVTFDAHDFLSEADNLITENKISNADVVEYLRVVSSNNYLEALLYDRENKDKHFPEYLLRALDNEWILSVVSGVNNLDRYFEFMLNKEKRNLSSIEQLEQKIKLISQQIKTDEVRDKLTQYNMSRFVSSYRIIERSTYLKDLEQFETKILSLYDNPKLQKKYLDDFKNLLYTSKGSDAPDVKFKDLNGGEVSLDQFKGKYIYIDFWASWCGPCLAEIPHLIKLEEAFKNRNIEFVSISLDSDKKAWHKKVSDLNLHGNQWEIGESNIDKLLNISGIPHFVIYDTEGKLMYYNAPRPSSVETRNLFDTFENQ